MDDLNHLFAHVPAVIAHRGANRRAPENSLEAFRLALELGAHAIELDVMLSRDRVPVVIHDTRVDRTTDGTGRVQDRTWAELRELDAGSKFSSAFRGARIPQLQQVLEEISRRAWINIELKNYATRGDRLEQVVVDMVERMGLQGKVLLSSFNPLSLGRAARLAPDVPRGLLTMPSMPIFLRDGWFAFVAKPQSYNLHVDQTNAQALRAAHARGARVCTWTVNDPADAVRLAAEGVDGIITDEPEVILGAIGQETQRG
jgi:glycerophosphoryl diester phosphodiesterase